LNDDAYINNNYIVLCTKRGTVKKTLLEAYSRPRANGVNAITVRDGDELLEAILTNGNCDILLAARRGKCVRFPEEKVRAIGRTAAGVRGITIEEGNEVISMICVDTHAPGADKTNIMVVSENGYGKRSDLEDYRVTNRGGKGVRTINVTEKTGALIAMKEVTDENDLMIINKSGLTIRLAVADMRITGRVTQGVKLINLKGKDSIAAVCKVNRSDDDDARQTQKEEQEVE
jgi:DNA gyrase subunit A